MGRTENIFYRLFDKIVSFHLSIALNMIPETQTICTGRRVKYAAMEGNPTGWDSWDSRAPSPMWIQVTVPRNVVALSAASETVRGSQSCDITAFTLVNYEGRAVPLGRHEYIGGHLMLVDSATGVYFCEKVEEP